MSKGGELLSPPFFIVVPRMRHPIVKFRSVHTAVGAKLRRFINRTEYFM